MKYQKFENHCCFTNKNFETLVCSADVLFLIHASLHLLFMCRAVGMVNLEQKCWKLLFWCCFPFHKSCTVLSSFPLSVTSAYPQNLKPSHIHCYCQFPSSVCLVSAPLIGNSQWCRPIYFCSLQSSLSFYSRLTDMQHFPWSLLIFIFAVG